MVQKKREAVIPSRVCPGEGVVDLLLCVYFPAPRRLLLCLCCNVLLLCVLLAGRACCWLANCAGRVLHGSHCNALLSHYPLQERSPRAPRPSTPPPSLHSSFCPPFLPAPQHTCRAEWIELHLHSEQMGAEKDRSHAFSFSLPLSLSLIPLLMPQFSPFLISHYLSLSSQIPSCSLARCISKNKSAVCSIQRMQNGCAKAKLCEGHFWTQHITVFKYLPVLSHLCIIASGARWMRRLHNRTKANA